MGQLLERLKTDARTALFSTVIFSVRAISIPISIVRAGYNLVTGNQTKVNFPYDVRVPREVKRIELNGELNGSSDRVEIVGGEIGKDTSYFWYEVKHVNCKGSKVLAESTAYFIPPVEHNFHTSELRAWVDFPGKKRRILNLEKKVDISCDNIENVPMLKNLAYIAAFNIASQIGDYSGVPVVDNSKNKARQPFEIE